MIEKLNVTVMYDRYYKACEPKECAYKLETRNDVLHIVTTLFGIVGGLTTILKFIITRLVKLIFYCIRKRNARVRPRIATVNAWWSPMIKLIFISDWKIAIQKIGRFSTFYVAFFRRFEHFRNNAYFSMLLHVSWFFTVALSFTSLLWISDAYLILLKLVSQ